MLAEFIGAHQNAKVEIHFNYRKYIANDIYLKTDDNAVTQRILTSAILENIQSFKSEILHFTVDNQLVEDISIYRAEHNASYPTIDILITKELHRAFIKNATLVSWQGTHMSAIIDTIKFFTENVYELATDKRIQNEFLKAKMKNPRFCRFYRIMTEEE